MRVNQQKICRYTDDASRARASTRRTRLGLDEGITAPATAGPHAHSNAACFARHRLAVVVRTVVVVSNRRGTRTTTFRKIIARHRAKRLERNGTNGQDRHATSFPLPPGPQEMPLGPQETPRDTRDEAGQRRGRLNSHCTQQSHCIQLSHRRRYRRTVVLLRERRSNVEVAKRPARTWCSQLVNNRTITKSRSELHWISLLRRRKKGLVWLLPTY